MDNLEKELDEDGGGMHQANPRSRRLTRNLNASSFFTETNVSLISRHNLFEAKEGGGDLNLDTFDDVPSTDNLYYMASKLQRALKHALSGTHLEYEYSSRSNLAPVKEQGERMRDSNLNSGRRLFLVFNN